MKKLFYIASALIVALIIGVIIGYAVHKPKSVTVGTTTNNGTSYGAGTSFTVADDVSTVATSTSILNPTPNDLYVTDVKAACENIGTSRTYVKGAALAALTLTIATSSTANPIVNNPNTNLVGNVLITISTSSPNFVLSSSTTVTTGTSQVSNIWAAGSYMTFYTNATNTALCTYGVSAISS